MKKRNLKIGVLALQGAFSEHIEVLRKLKVNAGEIRLPEELKALDGLIIPGGESTTILKLMHGYGLFLPLKEMIGSGFPVLGTCAGMICLAKKVFNSQESILEPLEAMDVDIKRNAFGRQVDSFETDLAMPALGEKAYHAVFIRAPFIGRAGKQVRVLAKLADGTIVAGQQGNILVSSFHPELTDDTRFHEYFLKLARSRIKEGN
jgi:pyridoxal 5'-phosphate synthase pdxT subunit